MKNPTIFKFVFGGLLVFALTAFFYQSNSAIPNGLSFDAATQSYASVYQSSSSTTVSLVGSDNPGAQCGGDKCDK